MEPSIICDADLDDEAAQDGGIDVEIDRDVAAHAGAEILP